MESRQTSSDFPPAANFNGNGPRSLAAMCTRILAINLFKGGNVPLEDPNIPQQILLRVFEEVKLITGRSGELPFHAWKVLSKAIWAALIRDVKSEPGDKVPVELFRFRRTIFHVTDDLAVYTAALASPSPRSRLASKIPDFLASLTIDSVSTFQPNELLSLATLKNLVHLHIVSEREELGERGYVTNSLLRGWSEMDGAFPLLQILKITNGQDISDISVQYVSGFPKLLIFEVSGDLGQWGDAKAVAEQHGWQGVEKIGSRKWLLVNRTLVYGALLMGRSLRESFDESTPWPQRCWSRGRKGAAPWMCEELERESVERGEMVSISLPCLETGLSCLGHRTAEDTWRIFLAQASNMESPGGWELGFKETSKFHCSEDSCERPFVSFGSDTKRCRAWRHPEYYMMTDGLDAYWAFAVIDQLQHQCNSTKVSSMLDGTDIALLPPKPFASLQLVGYHCDQSTIEAMGKRLTDLPSLILFRHVGATRVGSNVKSGGVDSQGASQTVRSQHLSAKRKDERSKNFIKSSKKIKTQDMLGSFGITRSGGS